MVVLGKKDKRRMDHCLAQVSQESRACLWLSRCAGLWPSRSAKAKRQGGCLAGLLPVVLRRFSTFPLEPRLAPHPQSAGHPLDDEDMLAYSGSNMLCIKTGNFPPHMQKLQGWPAGDCYGRVRGSCSKGMNPVPLVVSTPSPKTQHDPNNYIDSIFVGFCY